MAKITSYFSNSSSGRDVESLSKRSRIEGDGDKRPTVEGAIDGDSLPKSEGDAQSYTTGKHVVGYKPAWESEFSWLVPCFSEGAVYAAVLTYAGENPDYDYTVAISVCLSVSMSVPTLISSVKTDQCTCTCE